MSRAGLWLGLLSQPGVFAFSAVITGDTTNYNLRNAAAAAGWDQILPLIANVTVNSGIVVSANSTGVYGFDCGTTAYPAGSQLTLINNGFIIGMGGAAQSGGGGPAFRAIASLPVAFSNNGTVGGGGGAGGVGRTNTLTNNDPKIGGTLIGSGGSGGGGRTGRTNSSPNGTFAGGGAGASGSSQSMGSVVSTGGNGGAGGSWGAVGGTGTNGSTANASGYTLTTSGPGGGGAAGVAVAGNSAITWTVTGTRLGALT